MPALLAGRSFLMCPVNEKGMLSIMTSASFLLSSSASLLRWLFMIPKPWPQSRKHVVSSKYPQNLRGHLHVKRTGASCPLYRRYLYKGQVGERSCSLLEKIPQCAMWTSIGHIWLQFSWAQGQASAILPLLCLLQMCGSILCMPSLLKLV